MERPWDLWIRTYVVYNDNVQLVPDGTVFFAGDQNSFGLGVQVEGEYRFIQNENWTAGTVINVHGTMYFDDNPSGTLGDKDPNDFNIATFEPRVFVERDFVLSGKEATAGAEYVLRKDWLA